MFVDLLRLLCVLEFGAAWALLGGGQGLRQELLAFTRSNGELIQQVRLGVMTSAGLLFLYRALGCAAGLVPRLEAERDATLALAAGALAWLLGHALEAADSLSMLQSARAAGARSGEELAAARRERDEQAAEAERWREAAGKFEVQVAAIRKQAEGQADAYMRLMSENKSLQNQLDDFDLVMGGSRKKVA
mmetsp:Transcript_121192/g.354233  ORF Transcript_121192/g.354233 Transcript_121192/m.354233 type:complete len:190 (-) Transcript_121192:32-601(-)